MRKKLLTFVLGLSALMLLGSASAGQLSVSGAKVLDKGYTVSTLCKNKYGFYYEINEPIKKPPVAVYGFGGKMPLKTIVNDLMPNGWHSHISNDVDSLELIHWMGHKPWTQWLKDLAFQQNLAVIVDWAGKTIYLARL